MSRKTPPKKVSLGDKLDLEKQAQAAQLEAEKKRKQKESRIRNAYVKVAATEHGRELFRHLRDVCGFDRSSVIANPTTGEIFTDSTVYNEARRNLYLSIRKLIPPKHLVKIEFNLEAAPDEDELEE